MDEGRKRVLAIVAAILVACHTADESFRFHAEREDAKVSKKKPEMLFQFPNAKLTRHA